MPISSGDWKIDPLENEYHLDPVIYSDTDDCIAICYGPNKEVNAKAIAALPLLVKACESFKAASIAGGRDFRHDMLYDALKFTNQAIRKFTGEKP